MANLQTIKENPKGLYQRYVIRKVIGVKSKKNHFGDYIGKQLVTKDVDPEAEYFVLRLDFGGKDPKHILACRKAIHTYANEIKDHLPELAKDLIKRYPLP